MSTEQVEAAVPVRDLNSELALGARNCSALLHIYHEQKEQKNPLFNVIRDNQVVIVVGETGSGKTTQLTQ